MVNNTLCSSQRSGNGALAIFLSVQKVLSLPGIITTWQGRARQGKQGRTGQGIINFCWLPPLLWTSGAEGIINFLLYYY